MIATLASSMWHEKQLVSHAFWKNNCFYLIITWFITFLKSYILFIYIPDLTAFNVSATASDSTLLSLVFELPENVHLEIVLIFENSEKEPFSPFSNLAESHSCLTKPNYWT